MKHTNRYKLCMSLIYAFQASFLGISLVELEAAERNHNEAQDQKTIYDQRVEAVDKDSDILAYNGNCCGYESSCCPEYYPNDQGCCYYQEPCQEPCQQTCSPCVADECCEKAEYVDYTPYEDGANPGLYCLPGSTCHYACPTRPSGAALYAKQGRLGHRLRYGSEYTAGQWIPIMLHMRTLLPMTACSYRKILYFLQERPYRPQVDPASTVASNPTALTTMAMNESQKDGSKSIAKKGVKKDDLLADAFGDEGDAAFDDAMAAEEGMEEEEELSLEEMVGPIDTSGINLMTSGAVGGGGALPRMNFVFSGWGFLEYECPGASFFGDFNGNKTFFGGLAPIFMSSYGEHLLTFIKLAAFNFGQFPAVQGVEAWIAYFYNDFLTIKMGKIGVPLGNYWTYHYGICDKFGSFPLIRPFFSPAPLVPSGDIGIQLQGAVPLCCLGSWFNQASLTYQFIAGNGPSETSEGGTAPPGSIFVGGENQPDNNNDISFGGRIGFLPNDCTIFGASYYRGRWNGNSVGFGLDPSHHLYFEAAAFDWTININRYLKLFGEYIWSQYENNQSPIIIYQGPVAQAYPQVFDSPMFGHPWVTQSGYWAAFSVELGIMRCICPSLYWCKPCLWDSLELAFRSEGRWNQTSGVTSLWPVFGGFDYSGFDQRRFTICLGYYFTQSFSLKLNYDINYGETGDNFLYQATVGKPVKTGYAKNAFTCRFIYGW